jgi:hypothetical protein
VKIGLIIGIFLMGFGAVIHSLLFGPADPTLNEIGLVVFLISAITFFVLKHRSPVKMKAPPPRVILQFKNPKYGEMFGAANSDYSGKCEIIKDR